jgi:rod shape-determining protein MreD
MKPRVYLLIFLLLIPLQASLFGPLALGGITPDLGLAVLYCVGLLTGPMEAAFAGIAIGLLQDIGSASLLGFTGLTRGIVGLFAGFLGRRVLDIRSPSNIVFLFCLTIAEALLAAVFLDLTFGSVPLVGLFFNRMVPRAVTTALAGYVVLRLVTDRRVLAWACRRELQKEL